MCRELWLINKHINIQHSDLCLIHRPFALTLILVSLQQSLAGVMMDDG